MTTIGRFWRNFFPFVVKVCLAIPPVLLLTVMGVVLFMQTGLFKEPLRDSLLVILNKRLNAAVSIEELTGTFFSSIGLKNVRIEIDGTPAIEIAEIRLRYNILNALNSKIEVEEVLLRSPRISAIVDSGGHLNLGKILKPSQSEEQEKVRPSQYPLGKFELALNSFKIENGQISYVTAAGTRSFHEIQLDLDVLLAEKQQRFQVSTFEFNLISDQSLTRAPGTLNLDSAARDTLHFEKIGIIAQSNLFNSATDSIRLTLEQLSIKTRKSSVNASATVTFADSAKQIQLRYVADLSVSLFAKRELNKVSYINIPEIGQVEFNARLYGTKSDISVSDLTVTTSAGDLEGTARVKLADNLISYHSVLNFAGIDAGNALNDTTLTSDVNGGLIIEGSGVSLATLNTNVELRLKDTQTPNAYITDFALNGRISGNLLMLKSLETFTNIGSIKGEGFYNLRDETFEFNSFVQDLNLRSLLKNPQMQSKINIDISISGKGSDRNARNNVFVRLWDSNIMGRKVEEFLLRSRQDSGVIQIDTLRLETEVAGFISSGRIGLDSTFDLKYSFRTKDFSTLRNYIQLDSIFKDSLSLKLSYEGASRGHVRNLQTEGALHLNFLRLGELQVDTLEFSYFIANIMPYGFKDSLDFKFIDSTIFGDFFLKAKEIKSDASLFKDLAVSITKDIRETEFEFSGTESILDVFANLKGKVVFENERVGNLHLEELFGQINGRNIRTEEVKTALDADPIIDTTFQNWSEIWRNSETIKINFNTESNRYNFESFKMAIGQGHLSVQGLLDIDGKQQLDLVVRDLNLSRANAIIGSDESIVEGKLNVNASLKGSFTKPIIIGDWKLYEGKASEFIFDSFLGNIQYLNRKIQVNAVLNQNRLKTLTLAGYLPIDLSFKHVDQRFTNRKMNFLVHSEGIDLKFLQTFMGKNVRLYDGELKVDFKVKGTRDDPKLEGEMKVDRGSIKFPRRTLGQSFRNMVMFVKFDQDKIILDSLYVQSGRDRRSQLLASGMMNISEVMKDFAFEKYERINYEFNFSFFDFIPVQTKSSTSYVHSASLTGTMAISAEKLFYPSIRGDLQIRKGQIWVVDPTKARSVVAISDQNGTETESNVQFFKNLDMDLAISLPEKSENTVKSSEMSIALFGEINITKPPDSEDFFITGDVKTKKGGKYSYLHADFRIERGEVNFAGEPGLNPDIDILAVKRFDYEPPDEDPVSSEAQLHVTGKLLKPQLAITAVERGTGDPIAGLTEPADILSYIILGVKTDQLASIEAGKLATDIAESAALNAVLNMVAGQVGLQRLEYNKSTDDEVVLTVSKKISEDLTVSFEGGLTDKTARKYILEYSADSLLKVMPILKSWKKSIELEFEEGAAADETSKENNLNLIFYLRKDW